MAKSASSESRISKAENPASIFGLQNSDLTSSAVPSKERNPAETQNMKNEPGVAGSPSAANCPGCGSPRDENSEYCGDCGLVFNSFVPPPPIESVELSPPRLNGRYQIGELISSRGDVNRYQGLDFGAGTPEPLEVAILRGPLVVDALANLARAGEGAPGGSQIDEEVLPSFDDQLGHSQTVTVLLPLQPRWPSVAWERFLLERIQHSAFPRLLDSFTEDGADFLVEEIRTGRPLWDAWDDPAGTAEIRFGWLQQIALAIQQLHQFGVVIESLRPEIFAVDPDGHVMFTDLTDLLALPLPGEPVIRASFYTAPELVLTPDQADARADLFGFGALLFVLFMSRELADMDFARPGVPKPFLPQFPDVHPLLGRLISKTFCSDRDGRLPTDEAIQEDSTGFKELIRLLELCRRTLDQVRLEIASWTSTGMVRTYNEDAFALIHTAGSRQDYPEECALVVLADGMGGTAAGEVAAALAVQSIRGQLLQNPMFAGLRPDAAGERSPFEVDACKKLIMDALIQANKEIFAASQRAVNKRGMGCTVEAVYITRRYLIVGHAGDSRTYHFQDGLLQQITRDQTLVGRLVELGQLTSEEAATHPRRSELQQALGGRPEVEPLVYDRNLKAGDWIVICSDGLSNLVGSEEMKQMLQVEACSAQMAARRFINLANSRSAGDNVTVVAIRVS
jgi:serine/threonine protein phosphatase PrpC